MAGKIFLISGLLAYEHYCGLRRAFSKNRLSCMLPQITGSAIARVASQDSQ
jgi:hypothetical protein